MLFRSLLVALLAVVPALAEETKRPNILWLTCEDISPNLGCYGDPDAQTPHLDALARQSIRYVNAFSPSGVCAPSRSALISGLYPSTLGSHYMRCRITLPAELRCYPEPLRRAGYYCTNNVKEDYNFQAPPGTWDESSRKAHYRHRQPGQPFFAVFNNTVTHESQIRAPEPTHRKNTARLTAQQRRDPAKLTIPPFHPDTPEVRRDWARYHELITAMDYWVGDMLAELEAAGLADDTIVFFYSDHGVGLPRGKRWLYDTGMRVPLLVRFGKNFAHLAPGKPGTPSDRLVSFVDFGPTVLSLAGLKPEPLMQGVPFLGSAAGPPRQAVFGLRDRMDERNDCTRAVRDGRYKYIRNYQWFRPWAQHLAYMEEMPTTRVWRQLFAAGKLSPAAALWMQPTKPFEELYDLQQDPHEIRNLANSPAHRQELERLRQLHLDWHRSTRDLGLMPEAEVHARSQGRTRYALGLDAKAFPQQRLLQAAETVAGQPSLAELQKLLDDSDAAVRWWAATGLGVHGKRLPQSLPVLRRALEDTTPVVRVAAADALARLGEVDAALPVLTAALRDSNPWVRHEAVLALDALGAKAASAHAALKPLLQDDNEYVVRVVEHALGVRSQKQKK